MVNAESMEAPCGIHALISITMRVLKGRNFDPQNKLSYAMVVTVRAEKIANLYDQIVRQYATLIEPLRPVLEIPVQA